MSTPNDSTKSPSSTRADLFWSRVNKTSTCWLWTGRISCHGYGVVSVGRKRIGTHRFAWALVNGDIPSGLFVCHTCDVRNCVNPSHLFLGTQRDNVQDMLRKGRGVTGSSDRCKRGHLLAGDNLRIEANRQTLRICLACKKDRNDSRLRKRTKA